MLTETEVMMEHLEADIEEEDQLQRIQSGEGVRRRRIDENWSLGEIQNCLFDNL